MTELTDLSETDADNTPISGANIAEGCPPSGINNAIRNTLGLIRRAFKTSIFRIRDAADQTKLLAFDLSGQTTAVTRTQKTPNYDGTIASQALGAAIASATTTDIGAASGSMVHITGTTSITGLGSAAAGIEKTVVFDGILTLTHNAVSLILPGAANLTTAVGDVAIFVSEGSGNWRCVNFARAAGQNVAKAWGYVTYSGGVPTLQSSFNCSIVDTIIGQLTVNITNQMANANYAVALSTAVGGVGMYTQVQSRLAGSFVLQTRDPTTNNSTDPTAISWVVFGA